MPRLRHAVASFGVLCFVACAMASTQAADRIASASGALVDADRVLVIAHRGDSADYPENTLPAFESAVKCGADLVELDYHHTADGVPVVLHDATLDRTTNARDRFGIKGILVSHRRLSELAGLDAGLWKGEQFSGAHLPTLAEAIDTIQTGSMTLIERKAGDAKTCVDYLKAKNLLDKVVVQAFDWNYVADCHELAPELTLAALGGKEITGKRLDAVVATGARIAAWHQDSLSSESIGRIHNRGLRAWAFTVDDPRRIQELLDAGIDGIISNKPGLVREIIAERADQLVPASR